MGYQGALRQTNAPKELMGALAGPLASGQGQFC